MTVLSFLVVSDSFLTIMMFTTLSFICLNYTFSYGFVFCSSFYCCNLVVLSLWQGEDQMGTLLEMRKSYI